LDDPREANSAGGFFPAIWGTIAMTFIMTLIVVPFGVLAALYLREYAKAGPVTSAVRIAINNLAGVPSIVFGAFGLGFFCYGVGKYVDGGPENPWPAPIWFAGLAGVAVAGVAAFFMGLASTPDRGDAGSRMQRNFRRASILFWLVSLGVAVALVAKTPFFHGFYRAALVDSNDSTFGKGGLLWASLTLALLTVPVVIVATEESLAAVPNSMREGSYACGGSHWQTIRRIVLPRAMPGIMTGLILAMARGAGEVAPLMLVGVKKSAPELPLDTVFPYVHPDRSFMHLAYMIYDVGFQSPDSEAAKPILYTTTLLLIAIVALLSLTAVRIRRRLQKKFLTAQF
jgi:ABC-type phosphate transport system permease subunit